MENNVIKFPTQPPTPEEIVAWKRVVEWASTATEADWTEKYGSNADELRTKFYALFTSFIQERLNQSNE